MTYYTLNERTTYTELDNESVLLDMQSGQYFGLNQVGTDIIKLMTQGHNKRHIIQTLSEQYNADHAVIESDFSELISELLENGLISKRD